MNKSPEAFRTISEVADALNVPPHVLRFWELRFAQVKPVKRGGGRRYYRPEDVRLLRGIRGLLYDDGMTIKGVQKVLRERGIRHVIGIGTLPGGEMSVADEAAVDAPVSAAKAAALRTNGRPKPAEPQADLFRAESSPPRALERAGTPGVDRRLDATVSGQVPKPLDRPALRSLLAELQDLRATMISDPQG